MTDTCDYAIIGGGSAGCVLANRLSAHGRHKVVLLEAGRDTPPDRVEPAILDSYPRVAYFDPRNLWADLRVRLTPVPHNAPETADPPRRYEQARLMGGGSSLNDMQANRGLPADYDEWAGLGAEGWDWKGVLPYFRKLERDLDFDGPLHGRSGPIPVRRIQPEAWPEYSRAAAAAMAEAGFRAGEDQNGDFEDGYFPVAISNIYDRRVSAAIGYLDNAARRRQNLEILDHARVLGIRFDGSRAVGLDYERGGGKHSLDAREIILSSGAIHSPAFLMRAGIGPATDLKRLGIEVRADRPGVGGNLMEHPTISVSALIRKDARLGTRLRRHIHLALRYTSGVPETPHGDMYMVCVSKTGWHAVGRQVGALMTWVNKSYSRGRVRLQDADPRIEPLPEFAMLSDHRDYERLKRGFLLCAELFATKALSAVTLDPFPTSYSERLRDLNQVNTRNRIQTDILAHLLDGPAWLRKSLIDRLITEDPPLTALLADDNLLESFIRSKVHGIWHASCSCRMGRPDDRDAVVDPKGRVIGVEGLRVVDASVMPRVTRSNTNIPTIMIAEKMSDLILADAAG